MLASCQIRDSRAPVSQMPAGRRSAVMLVALKLYGGQNPSYKTAAGRRPSATASPSVPHILLHAGGKESLRSITEESGGP